MIRVVFEYLSEKYEKLAPDGTVYKVFKCCMTCVLYCLDQYVKFITKNAFIQIALHNQAFCPAAVASFWLIVRHAGRFGSAAIIGWIMMMLGKGTIVGVSTYITFLIVRYNHGYKYQEVQQPLIPAICVGMIAYVVGSLFLSIFSFSSTAILHCFIMAEDTGSTIPAPPSLQPFLAEHDKADKPAGATKSTSDKVATASNKVE